MLENPPSFRNRLINSACNINQFNSGATWGSYSGGGSGYVTDGWIGYTSNGSASGTNVAFSTSNNQLIATAQTLGGTSPTMGYSQRIEANNCFDFLNQSITISFDASASAATTFYVALARCGTQNTFPTLSFIAGTNAVTGGTMNMIGTPVGVSVTTTLTRYSVTFDLTSQGTNIRNGIAFGIYTNITATGQVMTLQNIQLEKSTVATPFEYRDYATELRLCQRYYEIISVYVNTSVIGATAGFFCKVNKYATPSLTLSTPTGTGGVFSWNSYSNVGSGYAYQSNAHTQGVGGSLIVSSVL